MAQKLVLVVVDGMTPAAFERAVEGGRAPALSFLAEHGDYRQATSVFPSLTPVCLTSIASGAGPGRASHPLARLVEPAGAPDRRVRLLLRRPARGRALAVAARPDLQHERTPPRARRGDDLRGARGRRPGRGRREHHLLPRPPPLSHDASRRQPRRLRAASFLLLRPVRVGPDGSAVRGTQPPRGLGRRVRRRGRALARHARRLRLPRLLPLRTSTSPRTRAARTARRPTMRSSRPTRRSARCSRRRAGRTSSSSATPSCSSPITARPPSSTPRAWRSRSRISRGRSSSTASNRGGSGLPPPRRADGRCGAGAAAGRLPGD